MDEFSIIRNYFAPLAANFPGSLALTDDAAMFDSPPGQSLVVTKDAISEGIHFIGNEDGALIAQKLLRLNVSDLAAMGAKPLCYFLAIMLPAPLDEPWLASFAQGLKEDQETFGITLAGGDSIATLGRKSFSITAVGTIERGQALRRNGAMPGDIIYATGTLGDSALGLLSLQGKLGVILDKEERNFLEQRYLLPQPRLEIGRQLRGVANSCLDISDGLLQDLGRICEASGCAGEVDATKLPLSKAAHRAMQLQPQLSAATLSGGDDYELLFTAPPSRRSRIPEGCSPIGVIREGTGVTMIDADGNDITPEHRGFSHF